MEVFLNINLSRLSRNFNVSPLGKLERPSEEDLRYLYIELGMTTLEIAKFFNKGDSSVSRWLSVYKIRKDNPRKSYTTITPEELAQIDTTKISRDFSIHPWVSKEDTPVKEDFEYLYLCLNWSANAIATYIGISPTRVRSILKSFNLKKSTEQTSKVRTKEVNKKYGVNHVSQLADVKNKKEDTCLKNHGVKYVLSKKSYRENAMLAKYGKKYALQLPQFKKKQAETLASSTGAHSIRELQDLAQKGVLQKFGVSNVFSIPEIQEKARSTRQRIYGDSCPMRVKESKEKFLDTMQSTYGVSYPLQVPEFMEKAKATHKKHYGVEFSLQLKDVHNQLMESMKQKYGTNNPSQIHIKHKENFNKDYWLSHFVDTRNHCFDVAACASYHGVKYNCVCSTLKKFKITIRHKHTSIQEGTLKDYLETLGVKCISRDRTAIGPQELDLYLPEHSLAIEYDGIMYHSQGISDKFSVTPNYHVNKTNTCEKKGIQLLHIFENEWLDLEKRDIWKSLISQKLHCNETIFARKTNVKLISSKEAYIFCEQNHLQGGCKSSVALGLFTKDTNELVSVMTFGKPRFSKNYSWELLRFCTKKYTAITGGASKLLIAFRRIHPGTIVSYANRRWSIGGLYESLGFTLDHISAPNYFYFKTKDGLTPEELTLYSRIKFQKHKLPGKLETFDSLKTERENMYLNNYRTIYDCGNLVYILE